MEINISGIQYDSCVNGVGFRDVIYVSGCWHNCRKYCHNKETHNPNYGKKYSINSLIEEINSKSNNDITISGGDGLTYQLLPTLELIKELKIKHKKNIWLYTGYTYEEISNDTDRNDILKHIDVLVDGNFNPDYINGEHIFRGDSSQRIIDIQESLKENKIVLYI